MDIFFMVIATGLYCVTTLFVLASSRRSVSQGAARKTAREKKKIKKRGERKPFIFSRAVFRAELQLTERLEEAMFV